MASTHSAGAGAGAGAGADARQRERSRQRATQTSAAGGASAEASVAPQAAPIRVGVLDRGRSLYVPVRAGQAIADVAEAVRKRRSGALRPPRLLCGEFELWPADAALEVLREGDSVTAVWDRSLREFLACSPAMLMVAEFLMSWAELCALGATCSGALRAVRGLELDVDVCELYPDSSFEPWVEWLPPAFEDLHIRPGNLAAWRVCFPRARCCHWRCDGVPATEMKRASRHELKGLRRLSLNAFSPSEVPADLFDGMGGLVELSTNLMAAEGAARPARTLWPGSPAMAFTHLKSLRHLRLPTFMPSKPAVFKALANTQLETLAAQISDADVRWLPVTLLRLESLDSKITDDGYAQLSSRLTRLMDLRLAAHNVTDVTDVGISRISQMSALTRLELTAPMTNVGLGHIGNMVGLCDLAVCVHCVDDNPVTDAGIAELGRLVALRRLRLDTTAADVTPACLAPLATCSQLRQLLVMHDDNMPFSSGGGREALQAADLAMLASLERLTLVDSAGVLAPEEEAALLARGVRVDTIDRMCYTPEE